MGTRNGVAPAGDTEASEQLQHARKRSARLVRGIATSVAARAATAVSPLLLIPIALNHVGDERYGVWMAISSITSMFLWADLGLGSSLLTRLSAAAALEDWRLGRGLVSTAYLLLSAVAVVGLGLTVLSYWTVPWATLLNAKPASDPDAIAVVCLAAFVVNIPIALVHRVLYATQRVSASNVILMLGALTSCGAAIIAVELDASPLWLIAVVVASPVVVNGAASAALFARSPQLRPKLRVSSDAAADLVHTGLRFVSIAIMTSIAMNVDNLIVARVESASAVADFAVVSRLFAAVGMLITVVNLPLWPANAEALARGDQRWVRRSTIRMVVVSGLAAALCGMAVVLLSEPILTIVGGGTEISAGRPFLIGLWAMWSVFAVAAPLFMVQNAAGVLRPQLVGWGLFLVVSVLAKIYVALEWGIAWIPATATLVYAMTVLPASYVGYRRSLLVTTAGSRRMRADEVGM